MRQSTQGKIQRTPKTTMNMKDKDSFDVHVFPREDLKAAQAQQWVKELADNCSGLYCSGSLLKEDGSAQYVGYSPRWEYIELRGEFTADELIALAAHMKQHSTET